MIIHIRQPKKTKSTHPKMSAFLSRSKNYTLAAAATSAA